MPARQRMPDDSGDVVRVHFYRAVVSHMDVWRLRLDATTNWAAVTLAAMITFSFSSLSAPHYVLLLAFVFDFVFLLMESRRYQTFDLWRQRFRRLNRAFIVPALDPAVEAEAADAELRRLARDLGRTVPHLSLVHAVGYRVRRNYGYLFALTLLAWLLKLDVHPDAAGSMREVVGRATMAFIPGWLTLTLVLGLMLALTVMAIRAPTHDILDWETTRPGWRRWFRRIRGAGGSGDVD